MAEGEEMVGRMVGWMVGLWQQTYHASAPVNKGIPKDYGRLLGCFQDLSVQRKIQGFF